MSLLTACQEAATELSQPPPASVFATQNVFARELLLQANRAAVTIAKAHDWRVLTTLGTLTGTGSATAFNLPTGFDRMPVKARLHSRRFTNMNFRAAADLDEWLYLNDHSIRGTPGNWIVLGGQMQIFPAMPSGETARFYFITNQIIADSSGALKSRFTADTDTFRLDERLLALAIAWQWRAQKRTDFAAEYQNYQTALSQAIGVDKGSRMLVVGRQRMSENVAFAGTIGSGGSFNFSNTDDPTFDEE